MEPVMSLSVSTSRTLGSRGSGRGPALERRSSHKALVVSGVRARRSRTSVGVFAQGIDDGPLNNSSLRSSSDSGTLAGEALLNGEKLSSGDMLKLFQDAQENMLFLNKQRLIAIEELQKVERDREFLMAKVGQVEAELNASLAVRETLEQKLKHAEADLEMSRSRGVSVLPKRTAKGKAGSGRPDPPGVWSNLSLRVDSMLLGGAVTLDQARVLRKFVASRDLRAAEVLEEMEDATDEEMSGALLKLAQGSDRTLHVVQIASELAPVASVGSLGSWVLGLSRALRRKGHTVEVILPFYSTLDTTHIDCLREQSGEMYSFFDESWHRNKIWTGTVYGIPVTFIDPQMEQNLFRRERPYGHEDDFERFTYFTRAALEYLLKLEKNPDVIHMHDWQTALAAPLFWDVYYNQGLKDTRLLFTLHDAHYQNPQPAEKLQKVGLDPGQLNRPDRLQDPRDPSLVNLLKGGVIYSNKVTTVSRRYAEDIKFSDQGCYLEDTFKSQGHKLVGLPTGLDEVQWDPSRDLAIPVQYSALDDFATAKAVARSELRARLGLPLIDEDTGVERPLVVCVVPSLRENDVDLIQALVVTALDNQAQFVFVGSSRSPKAQSRLEDFQRETESPHAKFVIHYSDDTAHLALASAKILACVTARDPSFSLTLAGLKYGALPVSRQPEEGQGIFVDVDDPQRGRDEGVGFFAWQGSADELIAGLARAINYAKAEPQLWEEWSRRAMSLDTSWDSAGSDAYLEAYWSIYRCN